MLAPILDLNFLNSMILGSARWKGGLAIKGRAFRELVLGPFDYLAVELRGKFYGSALICKVTDDRLAVIFASRNSRLRRGEVIGNKLMHVVQAFVDLTGRNRNFDSVGKVGQFIIHDIGALVGWVPKYRALKYPHRLFAARCVAYL